MTEVPDKFPDFSGNTSGVDKRILLGVSVLGAVGLAGLIYKLVSDKPRQADEPLTANQIEQLHEQEEQETHEDL